MSGPLVIDALPHIPGVADMESWLGVDSDGHPFFRINVLCDNGSEINVWRDVKTYPSCDVAVTDSNGQSALWAGASLLTDQPVDSVLSLIRMVAKEGRA